MAVSATATAVMLFAAPLSAQGQRRYPGYQQQGQAQQITCSSQNNRRNYCRVNWRNAELRQQLSKAACIEGRSWGFDRNGLWVDNGCRGVFAERRGGGPGGWQPGPGWNRAITLTCQSQDNRYRLCQVDVGGNGGVRMQRQLSDAACIQGRSWGWNRAGVWVDRGCRAQFVVDRRW
jgi:hypothetical protein